MDDKERQAGFMSALTTEHFVLQTVASGTISEAAARASLYVLALSSSLVAMGFASRSPEVFLYFAATILPALFLLGVLTVIRLIDTGLDSQLALTGIARIRAYYRTLTPEAAILFAAEAGRWPEASSTPALGLGTMVAFLGTSASMVAIINSIVAGAGIALLAAAHLDPSLIGVALLIGIGTSIVLIAVFYQFQRWRFRVYQDAMSRIPQPPPTQH
jgi:hypothetical protein